MGKNSAYSIEIMTIPAHSMVSSNTTSSNLPPQSSDPQTLLSVSVNPSTLRSHAYPERRRRTKAAAQHPQAPNIGLEEGPLFFNSSIFSNMYNINIYLDFPMYSMYFQYHYIIKV